MDQGTRFFIKYLFFQASLGRGSHQLLPERELQQLTARERQHILSVIRQDAILQVQVQLKAR
jgi:hypothetical protein